MKEKEKSLSELIVEKAYEGLEHLKMMGFVTEFEHAKIAQRINLFDGEHNTLSSKPSTHA